MSWMLCGNAWHYPRKGVGERVKKNDNDCSGNVEEVEFHPFQDVKKSWRSMKSSHKIAGIALFVAVMLWIFHQDDVAQQQYYYLNSAHMSYENGDVDAAISYLDIYLEGGNGEYWFMQKLGDKFFSRSFETVTELRESWLPLSHKDHSQNGL